MRVVREKGRNTYKGMVKIDFLATTVKARGQWKNLFKMLREKVTVNLELGIQPNYHSKLKGKEEHLEKNPKNKKLGAFTSKRLTLK